MKKFNRLNIHSLFYLLSILFLVACGGGGGGGGDTITHIVTGDAGSGGTIFPSSETVDESATASFTLSANAGFEIDAVTGCGGSLAGNTYTTGAISSDCTVSATFSPISSGGVPTAGAIPVLSFTAVKNFHFSWVDVIDATHYKLLENPDGASGFVQTGSDIAQGIQGIDHVVPLYKRLNASYILQSCNASGCTDSTTLMVTDSLLTAIGYFKASNTEVDDAFGVSVELSGDGNTLAVGAIFEDSDATGINGDQGNESLLWNENYNSGAVYVFTRNGASWAQQAYIKASNVDVGDRFGWAISLNENGNTMAVGAYAEHSDADGINGDQSDETAIESGAVYVFTRSGNDWSQQAYVKASNSGTQDRFGYALSLNGDGNTLAVGAYAERSNAEGVNGDQDNDLASGSGAVYVFARTGISWAQQAYVKASNTGVGDNFGWDVSLSADGNTLAVGASNEASMVTGINGDETDDSTPGAGAVYVFTRSGTVWGQQAYIKDSRVGWNIKFGYSVSLSGDASTLAVGAIGEDSNATGINNDENNNLAADSGAVYVFTHNSGNWSQQAYVKASNTGTSDQFGLVVSLSNDGNTLAVGAPGEESNATGLNGDETDNSAILSGATYLFVRGGISWSQQTYIKASNSGLLDSFGGSIDLSNDGESLAVGATSEDSDAMGVDGDQSNNAILGSGSGAVYLY